MQVCRLCLNSMHNAQTLQRGWFPQSLKSRIKCLPFSCSLKVPPYFNNKTFFFLTAIFSPNLGVSPLYVRGTDVCSQWRSIGSGSLWLVCRWHSCAVRVALWFWRSASLGCCHCLQLLGVTCLDLPLSEKMGTIPIQRELCGDLIFGSIYQCTAHQTVSAISLVLWCLQCYLRVPFYSTLLEIVKGKYTQISQFCHYTSLRRWIEILAI